MMSLSHVSRSWIQGARAGVFAAALMILPATAFATPTASSTAPAAATAVVKPAAPAVAPAPVATPAAAPAPTDAVSSDANAAINPGDTAWMLTSTALVLMMTVPGLALYYGGMVRKKNVLDTLAQSFVIT